MSLYGKWSRIRLYDTSQSTSLTSGSLVIDGGFAAKKDVRIGGNEYVSGTLYVGSNLPSTSKTTGAVTIGGGLGVDGTINANEIYVNGVRLANINEVGALYSAGTNMTLVGGVFATIPNPTFSGRVTILSNVASENKTTGALIVTGGMGITGNVYGSSFYSNGVRLATINESVYTAGTNMSITGVSLSVVDNPTFSGNLVITSTVQSISKTSGALTVTGGAAIAKDLSLGGTLSLYGNTSGTVSFKAPIAVTTPYTLTLPAQLPSVPNYALVTDINGNLSFAPAVQEGEAPITFMAANNVSFLTDVTGVNVTADSFVYHITSTIVATGGTESSTSLYILAGSIQEDGTYAVDLEEAGPVEQNLYFDVLPSGQVQYKSPSILGWVSTELVFERSSGIHGRASIVADDPLIMYNTTPSTSKNSGALIITGGLGVGGDIYATNLNGTLISPLQPNITQIGTLTGLTCTGQVLVSSTANSIGTNSGALVVGGGVGVGGTIYAVAINSPSIIGTMATGAQPSITSLGILTGMTSTGPVAINSNAVSSSITTGALTIEGGVGIGGALNAGSVSVSSLTSSGSVIFTSTVASTSSVTGALRVTGGIGTTGNIYASGRLAVNQVTTTGSAIVNGNALLVSGTNFTDNATAASATISLWTQVHINAPQFSTSNTNVTTTNASTFYIAGAPFNGTNNTITNSFALFVASGISRFGGIGSFTSNTASTSTTTGALIIVGGVGVGGTIYAGAINSPSITGTLLTEAQPSITSLGILTGITSTGLVAINSNVVSSSTTTGALLVSGGIGVVGQVTAGTVSATTLTGTLSTAAQPNVTNLGTLTGLTLSGALAGTTATLSGALTASTLTGTLSTPAQPNITSVGSLTGLTLSGALAGTTATFSNNITINSTPTAPSHCATKGYVDLVISGSNEFIITNTNESTSTSTASGSIQTSGGLFVAKRINCASYISCNDTVQVHGTTARVLLNATVGGTSVIQLGSLGNEMTSTFNIFDSTSGRTPFAYFRNDNLIKLALTTESTSVSTGALLCLGGVGVAKRLNCNELCVGGGTNTTKIHHYLVNAGTSGTNGKTIYLHLGVSMGTTAYRVYVSCENDGVFGNSIRDKSVIDFNIKLFRCDTASGGWGSDCWVSVMVVVP